ncbi:MAG TPA: TIGR04086 family membrane protein [Candidatus Blautia excrementipullorum]|nr:TIGR04086 family membrane protein [Candidatus Blautia excrementipullorum]
MKIKTVLKSLLLAYALTGAFLLLLALLVFQLDLGTAPVAAGIVAVYVISCLAGGYMAGKIMRKEKYFWGILVGLSYFLLLAAVSFLVQGRWDMSLQHAFTTFCMCLGGGALGGMLA